IARCRLMPDGVAVRGQHAVGSDRGRAGAADAVYRDPASKPFFERAEFRTAIEDNTVGNRTTGLRSRPQISSLQCQRTGSKWTGGIASAVRPLDDPVLEDESAGIGAVSAAPCRIQTAEPKGARAAL